jgi:hypothetical protein
MTIEAPTLDFTQILEDLGQSITIRTITRTVSADGAVTATSTSDTDVSAVVNEAGPKEKIYLQAGLIDIGDIIYLVAPGTTVSIYDQILWNSDIYKIRKIIMPPRINGVLLYKQILTVRDSTNV